MGKGQGSEEVEESSREETVSNKKVAAIYVRCSTAEQETDMQETELREYCERRGWEQILYRDKGQSGAKQDHPALNLLLSDLRKRKVDVILVWSLDRLARSLRQLLTISEECRSLGVDLVSLRQNIDTTLPAGRLAFQILGAVAEFERELLRDRVKAGMAQARRAGKRSGRPALRHFGSAELERIRLLRRGGASVRQLAKDLGTTQWMVAKLTAPGANAD
jgi:DNA invertase Pin-like site-specific DNA recombinase